MSARDATPLSVVNGDAARPSMRSWRSLFFFNDTATTEIYTLSLHDALPIFTHRNVTRLFTATEKWFHFGPDDVRTLFHSYAFDLAPKSTRLNSSHQIISYAVFCLKKQIERNVGQGCDAVVGGERRRGPTVDALLALAFFF